MTDEFETQLKDILNLTTAEQNEAYQSLIRERVFKAILLGVRDEATGQAILRNEDIILALIDIQAMIASSSKGLNSPTKLREWSTSMGKRLRVRTAAFIAEERNGNSVFDEVLDATDPN